jgi:hypothetical protein
LSKIYISGSQKSNQSNQNSNPNSFATLSHTRAGEETGNIRQDMSDSSLGDSLFSSDANKYFGSSESCRFNYESRRRCSFENEKCSFSDTCRNECNLRHCDCSSSYFSSDFDDTTAKRNYYPDDFMKHVNDVKRQSQITTMEKNNTFTYSHSTYEVPKFDPKRLEMEYRQTESDNVKLNKVQMPSEKRAAETVSKTSLESGRSVKNRVTSDPTIENINETEKLLDKRKYPQGFVDETKRTSDETNDDVFFESNEKIKNTVSNC